MPSHTTPTHVHLGSDDAKYYVVWSCAEFLSDLEANKSEESIKTKQRAAESSEMYGVPVALEAALASGGARVADPLATEPAKAEDTGQAHHSMPSCEFANQLVYNLSFC